MIIDGLALNRKILARLKNKISKKQQKPHLGIIFVGADSISKTYINQKKNFAEKIGAKVTVFNFPKNISEQKLIAETKKINALKNIHGIIIQMPIPKQINFHKVIDEVSAQKDVDGLGDKNLVRLFRGESSAVVPATAKGILTLLKENKIAVQGKNIVVVGRSVLVGKTCAINLLNQDATITICHRKTQNIEKITRNADILIVATGTPHFVKALHTHKNQIVIDVGISKVNDKLLGDVDPKIKVRGRSPVPGGVGPMTVASLFENLFDSFSRKV